MKKRALLWAGLLFFSFLALFFFCKNKVDLPDPFSLLQNPFTCTVKADIRGFSFAFDVHKDQSCLQITVTRPDSLAGVQAAFTNDGFSLYKDKLQLANSGCLQGVISSMFSGNNTRISSDKYRIYADGCDQNGDYRLTFNRQSGLPLMIEYKNAGITAEIANFILKSD